MIKVTGTSTDGHTWTFYTDSADEWRWRRTTADGKTIWAATEGYKSFSDCYDNALLPAYDGPCPKMSS